MATTIYDKISDYFILDEKWGGDKVQEQQNYFNKQYLKKVEQLFNELKEKHGIKDKLKRIQQHKNKEMTRIFMERYSFKHNFIHLNKYF